MPVFPCQGLYIGQPWIYHARWFKEGRYIRFFLRDAELFSYLPVDLAAPAE